MTEQDFTYKETHEETPDMLYSGIEDSVLRASVRIGDMMLMTANQMRVGIPESLRNPDWLILRAENVFAHFLDERGRVVTRDILKGVRDSVRRSGLNGDRDMILEQVASLMTSLRTQCTRLELPQLPVRVASSS